MMRGNTQLRGDFGNPKGTGLASIKVDNLESADAATAITDMDTFCDSLKTGLFTACNVGDTAVTSGTSQTATKPGAAVNIDSQIIVVWKKKTESSYRRLTIPGVAYDSTVLEAADSGKRLTDAAKTTLEGYLNTLMGWTLEAVVISGKWIGTR